MSPFRSRTANRHLSSSRTMYTQTGNETRYFPGEICLTQHNPPASWSRSRCGMTRGYNVSPVVLQSRANVMHTVTQILAGDPALY